MGTAELSGDLAEFLPSQALPCKKPKGYTVSSEIGWQIRGLAAGVVVIRVALDGVFAAGQYTYRRGA